MSAALPIAPVMPRRDKVTSRLQVAAGKVLLFEQMEGISMLYFF